MKREEKERESEMEKSERESKPVIEPQLVIMRVVTICQRCFILIKLKLTRPEY